MSYITIIKQDNGKRETRDVGLVSPITHLVSKANMSSNNIHIWISISITG